MKSAGRYTSLAAAVALAAAGALSGCATVNQVKEAVSGNNTTDYRSATKSLPPLEIPPDLTRPSSTDRFAVPTSPQGGSATLSEYSANRAASPKAGSTDLLPDVGKIRMERAGSQRWIVIPEAPEKVWPIVREFWFHISATWLRLSGSS